MSADAAEINPTSSKFRRMKRKLSDVTSANKIFFNEPVLVELLSDTAENELAKVLKQASLKPAHGLYSEVAARVCSMYQRQLHT